MTSSTLQRAWSTITIKSFDDKTRRFRGIATTPTTDRMGDIVEPKGAEFKLPIPFLYQHDAKRPIGLIDEAAVTDDGIEVGGYVEQLDEPPTLKERLDVAWAEMKSGMVRGLSIGFVGTETADIKGSYGIRFLKWAWLELSAVTIPANAEASITAIKSADALFLTAPGRGGRAPVSIAPPKPGATGLPSSKGTTMNTQEMIAGLEAKRNALAASMTALIDASNAEGSTFTAEQKATYAEQKEQVTQIDEQLVILRDHEKLMLKTATPILPTAGTEQPPAAGRVALGEGTIKVNKELPKGIGMARYVKALAFAKGNYQQAGEYAKQWDTSTPEVGLALKAAVSAGTTTDSAWAGPLVYAQDFPAAFLDYLRPQTIIGKLTGISHVPFNIRYGIQDGGSTVAWVGQGAPKPVSSLHFTSGSLGFAKAAGIVVITQELARFSSPSAELKVRDDLTNQMIYFLDQQFIDPGVAAVANVSPASILNGASNVVQSTATWTTMANVLTDVKSLLRTFAANEISLQGAYWIMTPDAALTLGLLLNTGGTAFAFPDITVNGGNFVGLPVIVSNSVPHSVSAGSVVALVVPKHVYLADDGAIAIDSSQEASLQMDSAPTNNASTPTATTLVSMFQTNSIAVRCERIINWARARNYGVGYIDNMHTS